MNPDVEARIRMLNNSLRCFTCGLLGLLPVIGLPFAFMALMLSGQVRAAQKQHWNAARVYWIWGVIAAMVGSIFWSFVLILAAWHLANNRRD